MINAQNIKFALLCYFRFKRQWICVDECMHADVIADTGKQIIEVEVKTSRHDLLKGELKKRWKHSRFKDLVYQKYMPNKFYFCVPTALKDIAVEFAKTLNNKYGVMVFNDHEFEQAVERVGSRKARSHVFGETLLTVKPAQLLHDSYTPAYQRQIAKRASCKLITLMQKEIKA